MNPTKSDALRKVWQLALALAMSSMLMPAAGWSAQSFTSDFRLEECTWSAWGRQNPYFSLRPGRFLVLEGVEGGAHIRSEITVLRQVELVEFDTAGGKHLVVPARVIEEHDIEDGELVEVSRNWYSRCVETSDIYYFGEEVDLYEGGVLTGHGGSWRAGVDGALPGLFMPGTFLLGARYYQEVAPGVAEDRAEHVQMGMNVAEPAGAFSGCVAIEETNALTHEPAEGKVYCPVVGLVEDGKVVLVEQGVVPE